MDNNIPNDIKQAYNTYQRMYKQANRQKMAEIQKKWKAKQPQKTEDQKIKDRAYSKKHYKKKIENLKIEKIEIIENESSQPSNKQNESSQPSNN